MLKRTPGTGATVLLRSGAAGAARQTTTMWQLLVWSYKRELVRILSGRTWEPHAASGGSNTSAVCRVLETGILRSGPVARITRVPVHADAEWVHGLVSALDRDEFWLVVKSAEAAAPPDWNPDIEPARVVPMLRANGRPRMIVIDGRAVACRIETVGVPSDEADAMRESARERYAQWVRLLMAMRDKLIEDDGLTRWRIGGIGVEPAPWIKS